MRVSTSQQRRFQTRWEPGCIPVSLRFECWRRLMLSRQRPRCLSCLCGRIWWCWEVWVDIQSWEGSWRGHPYWPDQSLCEVYEGNEEWLSLLPAFLLELSEWEDHVYSGSVGTEAALRLRVDLLCKHLEPLQYYACNDFPNDAEEGYAAIIIAIASVDLRERGGTIDIHIYIYIYTFTYIHIHTHTHIPEKKSPQRMEPTTLHQAGQPAQHTTNELFQPQPMMLYQAGQPAQHSTNKLSTPVPPPSPQAITDIIQLHNTATEIQASPHRGILKSGLLFPHMYHVSANRPSLPQGWVCSHFMCCHTDTEIVDQTCHLIQSQ